MSTRAPESETRPFGLGAVCFWLSGALAAATTLGAALTFWLPGILTGPPVMNGSARGTALVLLVVAVPALTASMGPSVRGSARALVVWAGALAYLVYNSLLLVLATPFNRLFLVYVVMLSLSIAAFVGLLTMVKPSRIPANRLPARPLAVYIWVVVVLNTLVWLRTILPALFADDPTKFLRGTGIATSPVFVQDLAIWLPAMAVAAFWLWHRKPWGALRSQNGHERGLTTMSDTTKPVPGTIWHPSFHDSRANDAQARIADAITAFAGSMVFV